MHWTAQSAVRQPEGMSERHSDDRPVAGGHAALLVPAGPAGPTGPPVMRVPPVVAAVSTSPTYTMAKPNVAVIRLVEGLGVDGDVHSGITVKHRSRLKRDPTAPNLRQVHLIAAELHDELREAEFDVPPGRMGENVTTRGIDLLALPTGTLLTLGGEAVVRVTGLRNPCLQLEGIAKGVQRAVLTRDTNGQLVRKAGVMGVVVASGEIRPGDHIGVALPDEPHTPLQPV